MMLPDSQDHSLNKHDELTDSDESEQPKAGSNHGFSPLPLEPMASTEGALLLSDRSLWALFEEALDAMVIADDDGRYVAVNRAACELFGLAREELLGRCITEFMPPEFDFLQAWQTFQAKRQERGEVCLVRPDGSLREVEYAATANFVPHRHLSILHDVTERKQLERQVQYLNQELEHRVAQRTTALYQANLDLQVTNQRLSAEIEQRSRTELALQTSEAKLNAILSTTAAAIISAQVFADRTYCYDYCSAGCEGIFGYPAAALMADQSLWWSRVHPTDLETYVRPSFDEIFAERPTQFEYRFHHQDGTWRWVAVAITAQWEAAIEGWRVTKVHMDITDRKHMEIDLQQANDRYNLLLQSIGEGVWEWDCIANVLTGSPRFWEILGDCPPPEATLSIQPLLDRVYPTDLARLTTVMERHLEQRSPYSTEIRMQHRAGHYVWIRSRGHGIWDEQGQPVRMVGTIEEISDRKQIEADAAQRTLDLQHQQFVMMELSQRQEFYTGELAIALRDITQIAAQTLAVERVGIWWLQENSTEMVCANLYYLSRDQHDSVAPLNTASYPAYFRAMTENHIIAAERACEDVRTQEFANAYLQPNHITALMDVPIRSEGHLIGVLCFEHVGEARQWQMEEQHFAAYLANLVALIKAVADRKATEVILRQREHEFRALAENTPDCIMRCDRQFRFLYVNPAITTLTELPPTAFLDKTSQDLGFPADLVTLWHEGLAKVFETGCEQFLEYAIALPIGNRTFYSRLVPELEPDGSVASVLVVARDITPLKQAQDALRLQAEREQTLRLITQHIRATLDLDAILFTAVTEVQRTLNADRTLIFRLMSNHSGMIIQEAVKPDYPVTLEMCWEDEDLTPECYAFYCQGKARIVPDVAVDEWASCLAEFMAEVQVKSKIVAPITQTQADGSAQVWGLLIAHACAEQRVWQPEEAAVLQHVANQLAIALQQSEYHQRLQQWADTLEDQVQKRTAEIQQSLDFEATLKRITDNVRDSLDENHILETVVQELGQGLALVCCDTGIYNADQTTSTITHEFTRTRTTAKGITFTIVDAHHYDIYPYLLQGQVMQFCDLIPCPFRPDHQYLTVLVCPILDNRRVLGDMWLYKQGIFTPSEVRLVQQVASQCAIALRQSRLYQSAQVQVKELERLNQLKDDFLSTVSHELRTPMSNIKMATQMLEISLVQLGLLTAEITPLKRYFNVLQEEGQREISLINDLLDLTRLDAGTDALTLTSIQLQFYIPHVAEPFIERTRQQQQELFIHIPAAVPPLVTDLPYLERILTELLHNACKYTPARESIVISAQATPESLEIRITNSGVEIPVAERDRIFDKFYRIPNNDPWKHGGTGLGLALVKKLIERLGGQIYLESGDRRTTFIVEFALPG